MIEEMIRLLFCISRHDIFVGRLTKLKPPYHFRLLLLLRPCSSLWIASFTVASRISRTSLGVVAKFCDEASVVLGVDSDTESDAVNSSDADTVDTDSDSVDTDSDASESDAIASVTVESEYDAVESESETVESAVDTWGSNAVASETVESAVEAWGSGTVEDSDDAEDA
jgi:hypothetical protein